MQFLHELFARVTKVGEGVDGALFSSENWKSFCFEIFNLLPRNNSNKKIIDCPPLASFPQDLCLQARKLT